MKCHIGPSRPPKRLSGFTLTEFIVAVGLGSLVLVVVGVLSIYGTRSFAAIGNYTNLDQMSRSGADVIAREIRQASGVIALQTNLPTKWLMLTNADQGEVIRFTWDAAARTVTFKKTDYATRTILTGCDWWDFALYQRTPIPTDTNILFYPAANPAACKLLTLSWKCSRAILGYKLNPESAQMVQVALRNKQ